MGEKIFWTGLHMVTDPVSPSAQQLRLKRIGARKRLPCLLPGNSHCPLPDAKSCQLWCSALHTAWPSKGEQECTLQIGFKTTTEKRGASHSPPLTLSAKATFHSERNFQAVTISGFSRTCQERYQTKLSQIGNRQKRLLGVLLVACTFDWFPEAKAISQPPRPHNQDQRFILRVFYLRGEMEIISKQPSLLPVNHRETQLSLRPV